MSKPTCNQDYQDCPLHEDIQEMKADIKGIYRLLTGNGSPGLVTRVDRLEQSEKRRTWWQRSIVLAVIGLCAKALWGFVKG